MRQVRHDKPIISSLFDANDFYKFTMGQFVWQRYLGTEVISAFRNRTKKVRLAEIIDLGQLREELDHVRSLRFNNSELHYLRGTNEYGDRMFCEPYLEFLKGLALPQYELGTDGAEINLRFPGPWEKQIYWETIALAIVNELYARALMKPLSRFEQETVLSTGRLRLAEKIKFLRENPTIVFSDFGSRRRFSGEWQAYVNDVLCEEVPNQFLGSSNTYLAMRNGTVPMGTAAHELQMVVAGLRDGQKDWIRVSQREVTEGWWKLYGYGLSIFLPDTYTTRTFDENLTDEEVMKWKGDRWDSGDPIVFGESRINRYERLGIDPKTRMLIPSDGLDTAMIKKLHDHFYGRIKMSYGWGTNLTNDLFDSTMRGNLWYGPLSLVIKPVSANGRGLVKLSDNPPKATGAPEDIKRYMEAVGYDPNTPSVECKY